MWEYLVMLCAAIIVILCIVFIIKFSKKKIKENIGSLKKKDIAYARKELVSNIRLFSGCFQVLYKACQDHDQEIVKKLLPYWEKHMKETPALLRIFLNIGSTAADESVVKAAKAWLSQLEKWGIRHDNEGDIIVIDDNTPTHYLLNEVYENGDKASVLYPCWYIEEAGKRIIAERGAAKIIEKLEAAEK